MFSLIFAELLYGLKRLWKLYLANIVSVLFIILLFAYMDGASRQLNLQTTVFRGEVVVNVNDTVIQAERTISENLGGIEYVAKKIHSNVRYQLPASNNSGQVEMLGVDLNSDSRLNDYLNIREGKKLQSDIDILVPTSILQKTDLKIGDVVLITGKNADDIYNAVNYKVCGFYNSAGLSLFEEPKFLVTYKAMENFLMPHTKNIDYCLFFKHGAIPDQINKKLRTIFQDDDRTKIETIETVSVSSFDVLNISIQMNVFFVLIITLAIIVLISLVTLVNFNMYTMIFRQRQKQIGTLMAFGVPAWKIDLTLLLESFFQILISVVVAFVIALGIGFFTHNQMVSGFLEIVFVLLSGTNQIDFYVNINQMIITFCIIFPVVIFAQLPMYAKVIFSSPIQALYDK